MLNLFKPARETTRLIHRATLAPADLRRKMEVLIQDLNRKSPREAEAYYRELFVAAMESAHQDLNGIDVRQRFEQAKILIEQLRRNKKFLCGFNFYNWYYPILAALLVGSAFILHSHRSFTLNDLLHALQPDWENSDFNKWICLDQDSDKNWWLGLIIPPVAKSLTVQLLFVMSCSASTGIFSTLLGRGFLSILDTRLYSKYIHALPSWGDDHNALQRQEKLRSVFLFLRNINKFANLISPFLLLTFIITAISTISLSFKSAVSQILSDACVPVGDPSVFSSCGNNSAACMFSTRNSQRISEHYSTREFNGAFNFAMIGVSLILALYAIKMWISICSRGLSTDCGNIRIFPSLRRISVPDQSEIMADEIRDNPQLT